MQSASAFLDITNVAGKNETTEKMLMLAKQGVCYVISLFSDLL